MNYKGELSQLAKELGVAIEHRNNGHVRLVHKNGTFVVASLTPSDRYAINNVRKDCQKRGWLPPKENGAMNGATHSLGDAIRQAEENRARAEGQTDPPAPVTRQRGDISNLALDYFRNHPDKIIGVAELKAVVEAKLGPVTENALYGFLNRLTVAKKLQRLDRGTYRWGSKAAAPPAPATLAPQATAIAVVKLDPDGYLDPDERELDEALAALGRIEAVVRKYKQIARQLTELKALLNKVSPT